MGTSKGYQAPTSPQWGNLKGDVTRAAGGGAVTSDIARGLVGGFIQANGGAGRISSGQGIAGGGRTAQSVAERFAKFINSVSNRGLAVTLQENNLADLIGKSPSELTFGLLDMLCEDDSTLDDIDVRNATIYLIDDLLEGAISAEQIQQRLEEKLNLEGLENTLARFFGYYIYHNFCRTFHERIMTKHGEQKTKDFLNSIKWFIEEELKYKTFGKKLAEIDWKGQAGSHLVDEILNDTLILLGG